MSPSFADREPEDRKRADFVVTGVVSAVYVNDEKDYFHYIVEVRIDDVDKGKGLESGQTLYVYCFDRKASAPIEPAASGHDAPPKKGQRIKAFVKDDKGKHEAIYPHWYDTVTPARAKSVD